MTTRALEDQEISAIFEHIEGIHAKRNETLLLVGIGMALRVSELVGLKVSDVYDGKKVKNYVNIRAETAKNKKERTIRIGDEIQRTIAAFIDWKVENEESIDLEAPLFVSQKGGHLTRIALFQIVIVVVRLTVSDVVKISGFCPTTVKKLADSGVLPHRRDINDWRIFSPEALEIAKELAGIKSDQELPKAEVGER